MPPPLAKQKSDLDAQRVGGWRSEVNQSPSDFRGLVDAAQRPVLMSPSNHVQPPLSASPGADDDALDGGAGGQALNYSLTASPERGGGSAVAGRLSSSSGLVTPQPRQGTASSATPPPIGQSSNSMSLSRGGGSRAHDDSGSSSGSDSDSGAPTPAAVATPSAVKGLVPPPSTLRKTATPEPDALEQHHHELYTFQKRSLRHSRQNWKSSPSMSNAQCLPRADPSVLHALARLQGRHHLPSMKATPQQNLAKPLQPAVASTVVPASPVSLTPQQATQPQAGDSTPVVQMAPATPNVHFSRTTSPGGHLQTSVIPSHAHPPGIAANRPPSQLALSELMVSPPGTASRMLSRNLLGLTLGSRDGLDGTMNTTRGSSTPDWRLAAAIDGGHRIPTSGGSGAHMLGSLASFQASASIIGALRPNSVMSRLAPIVSTSMGGGVAPLQPHAMATTAAATTTSGSIHAADRQHPSGLPPRGKGKQQPRGAGALAGSTRGIDDLDPAGAMRAASGSEVSFVGDPVESGPGGGMFTTPHPHHKHHSIPQQQLHAVVTPTLQTLDASGQMHLDRNAWGSTTSHTETTTSSIRDPHEAPHRMKTFGLKPPVYTTGGPQHTSSTKDSGAKPPLGRPHEGQQLLDFSSYESLLGPQWPQQSTLELQRLQQHQLHATSDVGSDCSVASPMGQLVAVHQQHVAQRSRPLEVVSSSPRRLSPVQRESPQPQQTQRKGTRRRLRQEDPLQCVERVCAWGYDLRSLFLVQLARDGVSLPRFVSSLSTKHGEGGGTSDEHPSPPPSLEAWVQWLEWGGSKPSEIPAAVEECLAQQKVSIQTADQGKSRQRPPPRARIAGSKEKQIRELQAVVVAASEFVAATFFRGIRNSSTVMKAAGAHDQPDAAPSIERADVRKLLAEQGLQVGDVCHMFRHVLLTGMSLDAAQQLVKSWLIDPTTHSAKVDRCMRDLVGIADGLRDVFMSSLHWNRQERDWHAYYVSVLATECHHDAQNWSPPAGSWSESHRTQLAAERQTLMCLMGQLTDAVLHFRRLATHGGSAEEPPETVETFCALHYLSLSDVCAWLARAPMFDRSILPHVWSFVIEQESRKAHRREPIDILAHLHGLLQWEEESSTLTPGERSDEIASWEGRVQRVTASVRTSKPNAKGGFRADSNADAPAVSLRHAGAKRVSQDKFVLETIIGKLRLHDAEDRHNAALHGDPPTMQSNSRGWRDLAKNVAVHRELVFRQEAELLKHVVKKRAEEHHGSSLEQLQNVWRKHDHRMATSRNDTADATGVVSRSSTRALSLVPPTSPTLTVGEYKPKCQETLESFLSIQSLATERLPYGLIDELQRLLEA